MHLAQRLLAINQVADSEADGDGVDAGIGFVKPADVPQSEFDLRFEFAGPLQHRLREVNADDAAARPGKRKQLVSQFAGAGAKIEDGLAGTQVGPFCRPAPPGMVAGDTEQTIPGVVAGRDLVEHLPDPIGPRLLPHATNYLRRRVFRWAPDCDVPVARSTVIPA